MLPNIITSISGKPKTGKTHLSLSWPSPIVVFSFDIGQEPVLAKFKGKDIRVVQYPLPIIDTVKGKGQQDEIKQLWDKFSTDFREATENTEVKTVIIDTWTALYQIAQIARAKELGQVNIMREQFGEVYARLRSLIHRCRLSGQNLVLVTYLRDRYVDDSNTGELEMDGWRGTESEVDVILWTTKDTVNVPTKTGVEKKNIIKTWIKDNRFDLDISGQELTSTNFDELAAVLGLEE